MASTDNGWKLEQSWPGLEADRDGVEYSPSKLVKIANDLWAKYPEVSGIDPTGKRTGATGATAGSHPDVDQHRFALDAFATQLEGVRNWPGGQTFAGALRQSHDELSKVYREVNEKLAIAFQLIDVGAGNYERANVANES